MSDFLTIMVAILVFVISVLNFAFAFNSSGPVTDVINESTCLIGNDCRNCPEDRVEVIERNGFSFKVCCQNCGPNLIVQESSDGNPICSCTVFEGNCWTGRQCEECFHGPNRSSISLVESVYICCANCRRSGKSITLTSENQFKCECDLEDAKESAGNKNDPNDWHNIKDPRERMQHVLKEHQKYLDEAEKIRKTLKAFDSLRLTQDKMFTMQFGGSDRKVNKMQDPKSAKYDNEDDYDDDIYKYHAKYDDDDYYNDYYGKYDDYDYDDDDYDDDDGDDDDDDDL